MVEEPAVDLGDSASCAGLGVVAGVWATEFFRLAAFLERLDEGPTAAEPAPPRLRFFMTSVFKLSGRTTPWSLRNKPHALHKG